MFGVGVTQGGPAVPGNGSADEKDDDDRSIAITEWIDDPVNETLNKSVIDGYARRSLKSQGDIDIEEVYYTLGIILSNYGPEELNSQIDKRSPNILLYQDPKTGYSILYLAVLYGNPELVKFCKNKIPSASLNKLLRAPRNYTPSPLYLAAVLFKKQINPQWNFFLVRQACLCELLQIPGIGKIDPEGCDLARLVAVLKKNWDLVRLVDSDLSLQKRLMTSVSSEGRTALSLAIIADAPFAVIVRVLNQTKTTICQKDFRGQTALHIAAGKGDSMLAVVKKILEIEDSQGKLDINDPDDEGNTPLHEAIVSDGNSLAIVQTLCNRVSSANPFFLDRRREDAITPLELAIRCSLEDGDWSIVAFLLERRSDLSSVLRDNPMLARSLKNIWVLLWQSKRWDLMRLFLRKPGTHAPQPWAKDQTMFAIVRDVVHMPTDDADLHNLAHAFDNGNGTDLRRERLEPIVHLMHGLDLPNIVGNTPLAVIVRWHYHSGTLALSFLSTGRNDVGLDLLNIALHNLTGIDTHVWAQGLSSSPPTFPAQVVIFNALFTVCLWQLEAANSKISTALLAILGEAKKIVKNQLIEVIRQNSNNDFLLNELFDMLTDLRNKYGSAVPIVSVPPLAFLDYRRYFSLSFFLGLNEDTHCQTVHDLLDKIKECQLAKNPTVQARFAAAQAFEDYMWGSSDISGLANAP